MAYTGDGNSNEKLWKERKEEYLYTAFIQRLVWKRSDMDHTVLPANYTMPAIQNGWQGVTLHQINA